MTKLKKLFKPITIGSVELKNRIVCLAMGVQYGIEGRVTDRLINFWAERAKGGAGLIIFGPTAPVPSGQGYRQWTSMYDDRFIAGVREVAKVIRANGATPAMQIGIREGYAKGMVVDGPFEDRGPSDLPPLRPRTQPLKALAVEEIQQVVEAFGDATRRAKEAGFDAVEFHAGIGYLINRFLSPLTNKRTDRYGGSLQNRLRFLLEIIDNAKRKAGKDYTLMCRISADEFMPGGHTLEDTRKVASILESAGVNALDIQAGWHESPVPLVQSSVPQGGFVYLAEEVKQAVKIPVIAAYRITEPAFAERVLAEGKADLIGMARALIADPELPNKAREGRFKDIRPCICCCRCVGLAHEGMPLVCSVNPRVGREAEYTIEPAGKPGEVLIIGGGPAGMEAARVAAQRGHRVTLCEKKERLGGQLLTAAIPPYKSEIQDLTNYLIYQVEKNGVRVKLGEEVTANSVGGRKPDVAIVATGAVPLKPDMPGVDGSNVVTALDALLEPGKVGKRVIIIGGGMVGCETAEFLAKEGKKVTVLEMLERIGSDILPASRWVVLARLKKAGIRMETRAKVEEITDKGVRINREGSSEFFEGDTVILAAGMKTNSGLVKELEGKVGRLYYIGDCAEPRRILEAIETGFHVGREI